MVSIGIKKITQPPVFLAVPIEDILRLGCGMYRCEESLGDSQAIVQSFQYGRDAVGGAARSRYDVVDCRIMVAVGIHPVDECGSIRAGGRYHNSIALRFGDVSNSLVNFGKLSRAFQHVGHSKLVPVQLRNVPR